MGRRPPKLILSDGRCGAGPDRDHSAEHTGHWRVPELSTSSGSVARARASTERRVTGTAVAHPSITCGPPTALLTAFAPPSPQRAGGGGGAPRVHRTRTALTSVRQAILSRRPCLRRRSRRSAGHIATHRPTLRIGGSAPLDLGRTPPRPSSKGKWWRMGPTAPPPRPALTGVTSPSLFRGYI